MYQNESNVVIGKNFPKLNNGERVTLAVSAKWFHFPDKLDWLAGQGFAIEYTPDSSNLAQMSEHILPYTKKGLKIRHHGFFPGFEFGDSDATRAERAMKVHYEALELMSGLGEPVVTCHAGLTHGVELDINRVIDNLTKIVQYGKDRGVLVSLENLRKGLTSNPDTLLNIAEKSGANITLDIGHAVTCERVEAGEFSVPEIVNMFSSKLIEVHYYERETDQHYAPGNMQVLGPIVDALLQTNCTWWTVELEEYPDILRTRELLFTHLKKSNVLQL